MLVMNNKLDKFEWVEWVVAEREKQGMSQADLSRKTGLTRATISTYEKRERATPEVSALSRISAALGYPEDFLPRMVYDLPEVELSHDQEQVLHEYEKLKEKQDKDEVLAFIRMKINMRKKNG